MALEGRELTPVYTGGATEGANSLGGTPGTGDDLHLVMDVPADMPMEMTPEAVRVWWDLEYIRQLTERIEKRLKDLMSKPQTGRPALEGEAQ